MIGDEEAAPRRPSPRHEIGQPVDDLSLEEIAARIALLTAEIDRLEAARKAKEQSRAGAEALFKS